MLAPDTIPPELAWPAAIVLVLTWLWIEAKVGRSRDR